MYELDRFPIIRIPFPSVTLARSVFVLGFLFTQDHFRRISSRFVRQKRKFSCWLSSGDFQKISTIFRADLHAFSSKLPISSFCTVSKELSNAFLSHLTPFCWESYVSHTPNSTILDVYEFYRLKTKIQNRTAAKPIWARERVFTAGTQF